MYSICVHLHLVSQLIDYQMKCGLVIASAKCSLRYGVCLSLFLSPALSLPLTLSLALSRDLSLPLLLSLSQALATNCPPYFLNLLQPLADLFLELPGAALTLSTTLLHEPTQPNNNHILTETPPPSSNLMF